MVASKKQVIVCVGMSIAVAVVFIGVFIATSSPQEEATTVVDDDFTRGHIRDTRLLLELARTPEEQHQGLSGRAELPAGQGMLFIFPRDDQYGFWMPDMHFSIDILWLDSLMQVVHIEKTVSPESYPTVFKPPEIARYVLEVPAGWSEQNGIAVGDLLTLGR